MKCSVSLFPVAVQSGQPVQSGKVHVCMIAIIIVITYKSRGSLYTGPLYAPFNDVMTTLGIDAVQISLMEIGNVTSVSLVLIFVNATAINWATMTLLLWILY